MLLLFNALLLLLFLLWRCAAHQRHWQELCVRHNMYTSETQQTVQVLLLLLLFVGNMLLLLIGELLWLLLVANLLLQHPAGADDGSSCCSRRRTTASHSCRQIKAHVCHSTPPAITNSNYIFFI